MQGAEQVTHFCRLLHQHQPLPDAAMGDADQLPPQRPLSDSQKLRKVILELIDTERCYVKVSRDAYGHETFETCEQCLSTLLSRDSMFSA